MGACASKQEDQPQKTQRPTPVVVKTGVEESNPMVSMSFLKKYSFATVNPAFADFENLQKNNPEEEEAISKLRILAQESFGAGAAATGALSPTRSERRVSFYQHLQELAGGAGIQRELEIEELIELPKPPPRSGKNSSKIISQVRVSEEKLVMSSSCMPSYSLGVVVNPEVRKSSRSRG